jgi:glycosyltransferase involved in cell wall biosynthesis
MQQVEHIKVSIITIVYNNVTTIEETILSVLNQTYSNIEYIIIDGGSTDGTVDIIKYYSHKIKFWVSERDKGISDAFNKGITKASGEIIGLINAGDWYELDTVQKVVNYLKEQSADIICGNVRLIGDNGVELKTRKSKISLIKCGMYIMHPTTFIKRQLYYDVAGFDLNLKIAMDFDLLLKMKQKNFKIEYINQILANMRLDGVSQNTELMHVEERYVMKKNLSQFQFLFYFSVNRLIRLIYRVKNFI